MNEIRTPRQGKAEGKRVGPREAKGRMVGEFQMGFGKEARRRGVDKPLHSVCLGRPSKVGLKIVGEKR